MGEFSQGLQRDPALFHIRETGLCWARRPEISNVATVSTTYLEQAPDPSGGGQGRGLRRMLSRPGGARDTYSFRLREEGGDKGPAWQST